MVRYNNDRGVGTIGVDFRMYTIVIEALTPLDRTSCLEKLKIVVFLAKHVSFIYLCEQ